MKNFNMTFEGFSGMVEASDVREAKRVFARQMIDEGKTEMKNVLMVMNKIKEDEVMNTVTNVVIDTANVPVSATPKRVGRPVNPNSARQLKLAERARLEEAGVVIKRGPKINPDSAHQKRLRAREELLAQGIVPKRGRPVNPNSARQLKLQAKQSVTVA